MFIQVTWIRWNARDRTKLSREFGPSNGDPFRGREGNRHFYRGASQIQGHVNSNITLKWHLVSWLSFIHFAGSLNCCISLRSCIYCFAFIMEFCDFWDPHLWATSAGRNDSPGAVNWEHQPNEWHLQMRIFSTWAKRQPDMAQGGVLSTGCEISDVLDTSSSVSTR